MNKEKFSTRLCQDHQYDSSTNFQIIDERCLTTEAHLNANYLEHDIAKIKQRRQCTSINYSKIDNSQSHEQFLLFYAMLLPCCEFHRFHEEEFADARAFLFPRPDKARNTKSITCMTKRFKNKLLPSAVKKHQAQPKNVKDCFCKRTKEKNSTSHALPGKIEKLLA